jgi:hypothetical protein
MASLALGGLAQGAAAQAPSPPEEEARQRLIDQAKAAHAAGNHPAARELAGRAALIRMSPSLRYFLAFEEEELGLLAEAYGNAHQCAREYERDSTLPIRDRTTMLGHCRALRDRIAPRIGHLVVSVATPPAGLVIKLNGRELTRALLGIPFVVTPGLVVVEASASGFSAWKAEVNAPAGAHTTVEVKLTPEPQTRAPLPIPTPGASAEPSAVGVPPSVAGPGSRPALDQDTRPSAPGSGGYRRWGLGLTIAGSAMILGGGGTWLVSHSKYNSLKDRCASGQCTPAEAESGKDTIRWLDRVAVGGAIGGGALLAVGSMLYVIDAQKGDVERLDRLRLGLGLVGAGITLVAGIYTIVAASDKDDDSGDRQRAALGEGRRLQLSFGGRF